jgi:hypothetical protein
MGMSFLAAWLLTGKDDVAVALMQGVLWSYSVRSRNLLRR